MSSKVITISDATFETEVLKSTTPVLVYCWATWCGPCRLVSPSVNWAAETYHERLKVVKMEVDPNPATAKQYKIEGIPFVMLFKGGEVINSHEGAITKQKLAEFIDANL